MNGLRSLALAFAVVLSLLPGITHGAGKTYSFGVVPQMRVSEVFEKWNPFLKKLSEETGYLFEVHPYNSIPEFETDIRKGGPDFAYMNPYHQVMVEPDKKGNGYVPLVKDSKPLSGILVARKGGPVRSVKDLNGKELAFPAPNAFAASLYMRALLTNTEGISFTPTYVKTHGNVYRNVILDKAAAGGGVKATLEKEATDITSKLTVIYETPGSSSHPISAHTRVPAAVRAKVTKAILKMASSRADAALLKGIQVPDPVEAGYDKDYLPLKKLGLEKFVGAEME